jgi:hypothetical protein
LKVKTVNPTTEEVLAEYEIMSKEEVNDKINNSKKLLRIGRKIFTKELSLFTDLLSN